MRLRLITLLLVSGLATASSLFAQRSKVAIFFQPGFPTIASDPVDEGTLRGAFTNEGAAPRMLDLAAMHRAGSLADTDLLVLPYGSAVPADAWPEIRAFLSGGGNLLVVGGQPLHVPVRLEHGAYVEERAQDSYARELDFRHTYEVPVPADAHFSWKTGYTWEAPGVHAKRYFAVEGRLDGIGYMQDAAGLLVAAPVIAANYSGGPARPGGSSMASSSGGGGSRIVALDFEPEAGYWKSADGMALLRTAAEYAAQGQTDFSVEMLFNTLRPGEVPQITAHLRRAHAEASAAAGKVSGAASETSAAAGEIKLELRSGDSGEGRVLDQATLHVPSGAAPGSTVDVEVLFHKPLPAGFYTVSATYLEEGTERAFYRNGFFVEERQSLNEGPALGVGGDFLSLGGKPFLPVGTNYFTTEENGWDFSGPRNAWVWDKDFAEMEEYGVTFVRTGIWMPNAKFVESTGEANERFLRNLEAYLAAAHRHHIAINFTLFAMVPHVGFPRPAVEGAEASADSNPYLNPMMLRSEQAYVRSVVARFAGVPWLCYDLINEPSFSNPRHIFKGNYPNNDPSEQHAWHAWLAATYGTLAALANAWSVTPEELGSFDSIPLLAITDLTYDRYGNTKQVRAVDYGLFAQAMYSDWVRGMVATVRGAGSSQLINVGQDEGGVTDRVLNQFYSNAGVSFTTNHTYWQDDALLWDSVAAKRPGMPNITGETGYQPAWAPDGTWRFDELSGLGLTERKWALGFAAGSSGALQWDWAREVDFGMQRSDGSAKVWENMMRDLGRFAREAAPSATALVEPDVAIVLPQAYQLSIDNTIALAAQQRAVRALFAGARQSAYAVGEYNLGGGQPDGSKTDLLGSPKLILLPAPGSLTDVAWKRILEKVQNGAMLLASGAFLNDEHRHDTGRQKSIAGSGVLDYQVEPLMEREQEIALRVGGLNGALPLTYSGLMTTRLQEGRLPGGSTWTEVAVGKGKILYCPLPLEVNDNAETLAAVYRYALKAAGVEPTYTTTVKDPGIVIAPTKLPDATLYVVTSETSVPAVVSFRDTRSGKEFSGSLAPGHAALLLVGKDGRLVTSYHWTGAGSGAGSGTRASASASAPSAGR